MMDETIGVARDRVLQRIGMENLNLRIELEATILRLQQATKSLEEEKAKHAPEGGGEVCPDAAPPSTTKH